MTDTKMLRNAIEKSGLKYKFIAAELGITPYGLQKKIDNESEFKASELFILSELLGLTEKERSAIFFARVREIYSTDASAEEESDSP